MKPETRQKLETLLLTLKKRPKAVLKLLLKKSSVSTYDLGKLGYDQPPRAAQDLKEMGVHLKMTNGRHPKTGSRMGIYTLSDEQPFLEGNFTGRKLFSKQFRKDVLDEYDRMCLCCGTILEESRLQIDHRVPYLIAGEADITDLTQWMPLCSSHQRTKSWTCEHCPNFAIKSQAICNTCYWAIPEGEYEHVAAVQERRLTLVWKGSQETGAFDQLKALAAKQRNGLTSFAKSILTQKIVEGRAP